MRPRLQPLELVLVAMLVAGGTWLRLHHLGTPSLWWDELVQIRTADRTSAGAVWHEVRDGVAPGTGNAAAVPLDYLTLHAWLRATPRPEPGGMERYYRTPSALFSCAALPAMWMLARAVGGPLAGIAALGLLATSLPLVLYAAEARFYSLYVLMTIASLGVFVRVTRAPDRAGPWVLFALANVAYMLSGFYGLFPIAAEYLVLVALLASRWRRREGAMPLIGLIASGIVLAAVLLGYLAPSAITSVYPRGAPSWLHPLGAFTDTLRFFASGNLVLEVAFALAVPAAFALGYRPGTAPLLGTIVLSIGAIPIIVAIAHWKHYYYHPRHALFLLPMVHLATALALGGALARLRAAREGLLMVAAAVLVVGVSAPTLRAYVDAPIPFFQPTKTYRDFAGLTRAIAARVATFDAQQPYLLLVERNRPGHLANPVLAFYLDAYGLGERVALRGFGDPPATLARVARACADGCSGFVGPWLAESLALEDPFDQLPIVRRLLGLRALPWRAGHLGGVGAVVWAEHAPAAAPPGLTRTALDGLALFEPAR